MVFQLSDAPLLRAMGFLVSQHGQLGAIPPPPFLSVSPLESMRSGGAIPPLKRGISAILARYHMKTRQVGAIPPSAILSRKGIARYGGVSRTGPLSLSDSVKRHLSRRHLSVLNFLFYFIFDGGYTCEKKSAFTKAASIPARQQSENADPRLFGFIFRRCPHLEYSSQFFELSTKATFAKAAFDTL